MATLPRQRPQRSYGPSDLATWRAMRYPIKREFKLCPHCNRYAAHAGGQLIAHPGRRGQLCRRSGKVVE